MIIASENNYTILKNKIDIILKNFNYLNKYKNYQWDLYVKFFANLNSANIYEDFFIKLNKDIIYYGLLDYDNLFIMIDGIIYRYIDNLMNKYFIKQNKSIYKKIKKFLYIVPNKNNSIRNTINKFILLEYINFINNIMEIPYMPQKNKEEYANFNKKIANKFKTFNIDKYEDFIDNLEKYFNKITNNINDALECYEIIFLKYDNNIHLKITNNLNSLKYIDNFLKYYKQLEGAIKFYNKSYIILLPYNSCKDIINKYNEYNKTINQKILYYNFNHK